MAKLKIGNLTGTIIVQIPFEYDGKTIDNIIPVVNDNGQIESNVPSDGVVYENNDIVHITTDNWAPLNNIEHISFPDLEYIHGNSVFERAYAHASKIKTFSAPKLKEIVGDRACSEMFNENGDPDAQLYSIDISSLEKIEGSSACSTMFGFNKHLTGNLDLHSLKSISGYYACYWMFRGSNYTSIDLSGLESISGERAFATVFDENDFTGQDLTFNSLKSVSGTQCLYQAFYSCGIRRMNFPALKEIRGTGNRFFHQLNYTTQGDAYLCDSEINFDVLETVYDSGWSSGGMFYQMCGSSKKQRKVYFYSIKTVTASYSISNSKHPFYNLFNTTYSAHPHEIHFPMKFSSRASSWTISNCSKFFDIVTEITVNDVVYNRSEENVIRDSNFHKTALCFIDENDNRIYFPCVDTYETKTQPVVGDTLYSDPECSESVGTVTAIA